MRRLFPLLLLATSTALAQSTPLTPLRVARIFMPTAPSTTPGDCTAGVSPNVFANDTGVEYKCVTTTYTAMPVAEVDGSTTNEIEVVDEAYSSGNFNGDTAHAVSQDDLYDYLHVADPDDDGKPSVIDTTTDGFVKTSGGGGALVIDTATYITAAGVPAAETDAAHDACSEIANCTPSAPDGTGSGDYVARWIDSNTLGFGVLHDDGSTVTIDGSGASAALDLSFLTGPFTYSFPDGGGMFWTDDMSGTSGLSRANDPLLDWTPAASSGGGLRAWAGAGSGSYFKCSMNTGGVDLVTCVTAASGSSGWVFGPQASGSSAGPYFKVNGTGQFTGDVTFGGTVNRVTITQPASGSTLTIDNGFTLRATGNVTALSGSHTGTSGGTNTGDQTITLTGDVTGAGTGSFAATIANDAVTYAKIQNVSATGKLLGRSTAGAGDIEEIACDSVCRGLLDDTTAAAQRITLGLEQFTATSADTAINSTSDVQIISQAMAGIAAGDKLVATGSFQVLNNSGSARLYIFTFDWDALFDAEIGSPSLTASATQEHVFFFESVLDVRSSGLAYVTTRVLGTPAAGVVSGADPVMAAAGATHGVTWGTTASDATGSTTFTFHARSADATATQTLRLHDLTIRRVTP